MRLDIDELVFFFFTAIENPVWTPPTHVVTHHHRPLYPPKNLVSPSFCKLWKLKRTDIGKLQNIK